MPNLLKEYSTDIPRDIGKSKVLFVTIDGLRGKAVQDLEPSNFRKLKRKSLYTFGGLADTAVVRMTNESGWANLLTGVEPGKHRVVSSSFDNADFGRFPSLFTRLKNASAPFKSAAFTSSAILLDQLAKDASVRVTSSGDDSKTLTSALAEIKGGDSDLIFVQFADVEKAGVENSYSSEDVEYADAVRAADTKVGQLVDALEDREHYQSENWLVIVTSNKGGYIESEEVDNTVYGDNTRNTFTLMYSAKFAERVLARPNSSQIPFIGNAVRYTSGSPAVNAILDQADNFNFGTDKDFTINLFLKTTNAGGAWNYPIFLSKRVAGFSGAGWNFFGENRGGNTAWGFNSSIGGQVFGTAINDGNWHALTIVVKRTGSADSIKAFTDGVLNQGTTANGNNLNNTSPLAIGRWNGNNNDQADWMIANLQIYGTAFSDQEVKEFAGITQITSAHAKYASLLGYWPGYDDVGTGRLTEATGKAENMRLTGPYSWISFSEVVSFFRPPISYAYYRSVPNSVDLPFMIYKWMGINSPANWQLDGRSWTPTFIDIRE
ncbi:LamG-like jellyroll fold domain-containing protein [Sphingobacterium suaedae]|uniref:LamG-like jellyroll fold domain-containing protein n=1 Tax=Sphingobacterium suaedae TaxID=1686402 RepID=A0ABW5KJZ1_9SPHI